jgi:acyl dehydratase
MHSPPRFSPIEADLEVGIEERYFEDYAPGMVTNYGPIEVDAAEIIDFARRYDPQEFHVDPARAADGPFRGLVASGWHTASMMMRVLVDRYLSRVASLGSPGVDELRWLAPVRPGDRLWVHITVLEARRSRSKPDRGMLRYLIEVCSERGDILMTVKAMTLMLCRNAAVQATGASK